ncbi:LDCC motif putative metal-binding protein [Tissierella simiarum]|nr:LDCC motif putative metal-binding protein [Tissierella simiarum]
MFKWIKKMLDKITKANNESFGQEKLDCCQLSKKVRRD